jgi:four helix bundle protein
MKSYNDLEVYQEAFKLAIKVHEMTMRLPKYELFEQGSQVRRSSKSIKDTIVEGFGRRRYKAEFLKYLIYSQGSCDECISQLHMIQELYGSEIQVIDLIEGYNILGRKINKLIQFIENQ